MKLCYEIPMSHLITFEGGEGSGKSCQIKMLMQALEAKGRSCLLTREPGGTEIGKEIRKILLTGDNQKLHPMTELILYTADRVEHIERVIRPALNDGKIVLCDRFTDATLVYQGYARGLPLASIQTLNKLATGNLQPTITFLLDCPVEIGLRRARRRLADEGSLENRFENEDATFHEKIRQGYLRLAAAEPKRFHIIDSTQNIQHTHLTILEKVKDL